MEKEEIHWESGYFPEGECDYCKKEVTHRLFDDESAEAEALESRCDEHWSKGIGKRLLKKHKKAKKCVECGEKVVLLVCPLCVKFMACQNKKCKNYRSGCGC